MGPGFRMGRRRGLVVGAAVGSAVARNSANKQAEAAAQAAAPQAQAPAPASDTDDQFAQLEKLGQLKAQGILTQEEFDAKKKQILGL